MEKNDKLYYSIGEVANMFNVNTSLIRYWEKEFSIIKPHKNSRGNRMFTANDVDNFHLIYHLVKEKGMKLDGAKKMISGQKEEAELRFELVKHLKNIRGKLEKIKSKL